MAAEKDELKVVAEAKTKSRARSHLHQRPIFETFVTDGAELSLPDMEGGEI